MGTGRMPCIGCGEDVQQMPADRRAYLPDSEQGICVDCIEKIVKQRRRLRRALVRAVKAMNKTDSEDGCGNQRWEKVKGQAFRTLKETRL
jgi:recombinational DNA repair protein (RecF pathway)